MANTLPCPGRSRSSILRGAAKDMKGPKGQKKSKPLWHMWSVRGSEKPEILVRSQGVAPEEKRATALSEVEVGEGQWSPMGNGCPTACEAVVEGFDSPRSPQGMADRAERGAGRSGEEAQGSREVEGRKQKGAIV